MMSSSSAVVSLSKRRIVLVLQADQALWFQWLDDVLLDSFVEPISTHPLKIGSLCPWLAAEQDFKEIQIELVLDTALDELDKVKSDAAVVSGFQVMRRWQLERRMQEDYPLAAIYTLPRYMAPDVLSIHHQVIPDTWCVWLQRLQENHVVVTHVVTATELLTQLQHVHGSPVLFVMPSGPESRHLLVDKGIPLFMRMVNVASTDNEVVMQAPTSSPKGEWSNTSSGLTVELNDTLEYVSSTVLREDQSVCVLKPINDREGSSNVRTSAEILATLCVNLPIEFSIQHWRECVLSDSTMNIANAYLPAGGWFVSRILRQCYEQLPCPLPILASSSLNPGFSVTGKRCRDTQALVSSVKSSALRQRISALRNATVVSALMATITVMLAGAHGIHSARERVHLVSVSKQIEEKLVPLSSAVEALHNSPDFAFRSLQRIEAHQVVKPLEPQIILSMVAGAITDFPSLKLDSLSWAVIGEGDTSYDDVEVNARMLGREKLWTPDTPRSQIHIELSGVVSSDQGLREQQSAVKSFVVYLEAVEGISRVSVLESPAQAARSSQVLVNTGARYRLSLVLGTS